MLKGSDKNCSCYKDGTTYRLDLVFYLWVHVTFWWLTEVIQHIDVISLCSNVISSVILYLILHFCLLVCILKKRKERKSSNKLRHSPVTQMGLESGYSNTVILWLSWSHQSVSSEVLHCGSTVIDPTLTQLLHTDNDVAPNPEANKSEPCWKWVEAS